MMLVQLAGPAEPSWFCTSITAVLDRADVVLSARGPRELDQVTAELLGAELERVLARGNHDLWFGQWFGRLACATASRTMAQLAGADEGWRASWRLLHGLASIGSATLRAVTERLIASVADVALPREPAWLGALPALAASGDVWLVKDVYGTRIGVVAGFCYPDDLEPAVFLFDVDAAGIIGVVGAGVFDDVDDAVTAWRESVGAAATGMLPRRAAAADLLCLVHCEFAENAPNGTESRILLNNWFRAARRAQELADVLRDRGTPLPASRSLYQVVDPSATVAAFVEWHTERYGTVPQLQAVDSLAEEWMEGILPDTWHAISPDRLAFKRMLIDDWMPDDPVTVAVKALLPEWVRWHGEQAGLPDHLIDSAVATVSEE